MTAYDLILTELQRVAVLMGLDPSKVKLEWRR